MTINDFCYLRKRRYLTPLTTAFQDRRSKPAAASKIKSINPDLTSDNFKSIMGLLGTGRLYTKRKNAAAIARSEPNYLVNLQNQEFYNTD